MQSGKYRSRIGVYLDILDSLNEGPAIATHIVQRTNLSYDHFVEYIEELVRSELVEIEESHNNRYFSLTSKGRTFLGHMKNAEEVLSSLGLSLKY